MGGARGDLSIDLAVIGAGAAGTAVAHAMRVARPDWTITVFERSDRIGGRLRSVRVEGLDHPIELGGMRFVTNHRRVAGLVESLGLATHPFDPTPGALERSYLRGVVGDGADSAAAGRGYDLTPEQPGRRAAQLAMSTFEQIVPGFPDLDHDGYVRRRATGTLFERPVTGWAIGEVLEKHLGPEGRRFVNDVFGYDSGMRAFNAPDLVEFLYDGGDPAAQARTPDEGMDRIPRALAEAFGQAGGAVFLDHELSAIEKEDQTVVLRFANNKAVAAARVVLAIPVPALRLLASSSSALRSSAFERVFGAVEGFP